MAKRKKTSCPGIETCAGSQVDVIYESVCNVPGNCGHCGHFVTRQLIKEHHEILDEPYRMLVKDTYKWIFSDLGKLEGVA